MTAKKTDDTESSKGAPASEEWDTERSVHDLNPAEFHLHGTTGYITARFKSLMEEDQGFPVVAVRTRTFRETGKVWIAPCEPTAKGARQLSITDTMGAAHIGFAIPLRKLGLKLPASRRLVFSAKRVEEVEAPTYVISFADYKHFRVAGNNVAAAQQVGQQNGTGGATGSSAHDDPSDDSED